MEVDNTPTSSTPNPGDDLQKIEPIVTETKTDAVPTSEKLVDSTKTVEEKSISNLLKDLEGESDSEVLEKSMKEKKEENNAAAKASDAAAVTVDSATKEDDVEMEDLTEVKAKNGTAATEATVEKKVNSVDSTVTSKDDSEVKPLDSVDNNDPIEYQDVEKKISSLFNGDDVVESSEAKIEVPKVEEEKMEVSTTNETESKTPVEAKPAEVSEPSVGKVENGEADSREAAEKIEEVKVEPVAEPVKVVEKADKVEPLPSSVADAVDGKVEVKAEEIKETPKVENKPLTNLIKNGSSTPNPTPTPTTGPTVFNSTPISKQFEISSENVSQISEVNENSHCEKSEGNALSSEPSSCALSKSSDICSSNPFASESSDHQTSDNLARFSSAIRKLNGIGDEADAAESKVETATSAISTTQSEVTTSSVESVYEINIWQDTNKLLIFSVDADKTNAGSSAISSSSSTLPEVEDSKKQTFTVTGTGKLCDFVIDHFEKVRSTLREKSVGADGLNESSIETPPSNKRGRVVKDAATPTSTTTPSNKRKRASTALEVDEPKSAKKTKTVDNRKTVDAANAYPEKAVLARWVDKKYYAGRVIEQKPNDRYVVLFEDGAKKVLPEDNIVFGEENVLPLENECVHALVKDETYEPGIVTAVKPSKDGVFYTVTCESTTVTVTASDIYLEEDQAKIIMGKRSSSKGPKQPEPGTSGAISTRKDRRQKRSSNAHF